MQVGSERWCQLLREGAACSGLSLSHRQVQQMARHAAELLGWNRKINLTAITDPEEVAVKHFLDSILPLAHIPSAGELLDMGTGGGFPGIPIKILRPDQPVTLVDSSRKKINFLKSVIRQLDLEGISAVQMRMEEMATLPAYRNRFNTLVSRAFTDLERIVATARPLLRDKGYIITYQGPGGDARQNIGRHVPAENVSTHSYQLPFTADRRVLVLVACP